MSVSLCKICNASAFVMSVGDCGGVSTCEWFVRHCSGVRAYIGRVDKVGVVNAWEKSFGGYRGVRVRVGVCEESVEDFDCSGARACVGSDSKCGSVCVCVEHVGNCGVVSAIEGCASICGSVID